MNFKFKWQWLNSDKEWILFDEKIQKILTDSFENNLVKVIENFKFLKNN